MADKVQLIKQEIERRIVQAEEFAKRAECANDDSSKLCWDFVATQNKSLLQFINSLPEEHNEDLEKELSLWLKENCDNNGFFNQLELARHFAEWQKQKNQSTIELAEDHAILAGMNKMKEEMMENAVEGVIDIRKWPAKAQIEFYDKLPVFNVRTGDKVKIIIVKPEQQ